MTLVIGVDIGGTKIEGILMNEKYKVLKKYRRLTEAGKNKKKIIRNIVEVIKELRVAEVKKVGVGIAGFQYKGFFWGSPNIRNLVGMDVKKELEKRTKLKITIENDTNCFALAEHRIGAAKGCRDSIGIIHGTGVGVGLVLNNHLRSVANRGVAEGGHSKLVVDYQIREIESLVSGPSIIKTYEAISGKKAESPAVILDKKDEAAKQVYAELILHFGLFLSNLIQIINPECIVIGGGVSNLPYYKDLQKTAGKYAVPALGKACKIKQNALGDDSGVIGAAILALEN